MVSAVCQSAIVSPGGVDPPAGLRFVDGRVMAPCHRLPFIVPVGGNPDAGSFHGPTMSKSDGRTIIAQPRVGADKAHARFAAPEAALTALNPGGPLGDKRSTGWRAPCPRHRQSLRQTTVFPWVAYQRYTSLSYPASSRFMRRDRLDNRRAVAHLCLR